MCIHTHVHKYTHTHICSKYLLPLCCLPFISFPVISNFKSEVSHFDESWHHSFCLPLWFANSWKSLLFASCFWVSPSLPRWGVEVIWVSPGVDLWTKFYFISGHCLLTHLRILPKISIRSTGLWFTQSAPWKTRACVCPAFLAFLRENAFCMTFHWPGSSKGNIHQ